MISTLRHPFFKPVIFTLLVGVVSGCSAQRNSLIPGAEALVAQTGFPRGRNAQARIVSQTVRAGGKTYVVDEMFTPIETTLQGIASASDSNVWFTGNGIVGKSSITGDMTDYDLSPYQNVTAITEGPDHNLWTTLSPPGVGRITTAGTFDAFAIPKHFAGKNTTLYSIASGFGDLWALDQDYYRYYLLDITPKGQIRGFKLSDNSVPNQLTAASDGSVWFTDYGTNSIDHMIAPGKFKRYQIPTQNAGPLGICQAPDGSIWFVEASANKIAGMTPSGTFKEFAVPTPESGATGIVAGPDGALWFTEARGQVGRMTVSGKFVELPVKGEYYSYPDQITVGSDKNIWFTEQWGFGVLGRIELHDIKKSDPKYLSITLSLEKQPQLGVAQNIPVKVQVRDLHGKIVTGKYPYPVHLTTTDPQNAALSRVNVTSSQEAVGVNFSGADSDATIGATANGGARLTPALLVPSTPKEYPLPDDSSDLALGAHDTLWMCLANGNITSRSPDGTIHDYTATGPFSQDGCAIVEGPDGNAWFTDYSNDRIGKITPKGKVTFVDLGYHATPYWIVLGPDGALWFTEQLQKKIGRLTTDGKLTTFATQQFPLYIAATPNGNLWFDDEGSLYKMNLKGKQTLIGGIEYYGTPLWSAKGALWYLNDSKLEELDATGKVIGRYEYPRDCAPTDLTTTPDGNLWYYDAGNRCVGRMTPSGVFSTVLTYNRNNSYFNTPGIVYGPKNDIWFDEPGNKGLGWVDPTTI